MCHLHGFVPGYAVLDIGKGGRGKATLGREKQNMPKRSAHTTHAASIHPTTCGQELSFVEGLDETVETMGWN